MDNMNEPEEISKRHWSSAEIALIAERIGFDKSQVTFGPLTTSEPISESAVIEMLRSVAIPVDEGEDR
jgi:hypothetical protein